MVLKTREDKYADLKCTGATRQTVPGELSCHERLRGRATLSSTLGRECVNQPLGGERSMAAAGQYSARNASSSVVLGVLSHPRVQRGPDMVTNYDAEAGVSLS